MEVNYEKIDPDYSHFSSCRKHAPAAFSMRKKQKGNHKGFGRDRKRGRKRFG